MAGRRGQDGETDYDGAELVDIRHQPAGDGPAYELEVTRKSWDAGVYPRSEGFSLLSEPKGAPRRASRESAATRRARELAEAAAAEQEAAAQLAADQERAAAEAAAAAAAGTGQQ